MVGYDEKIISIEHKWVYIIPLAGRNLYIVNLSFLIVCTKLNFTPDVITHIMAH